MKNKVTSKKGKTSWPVLSADQQSRLQVYFSKLISQVYWGEQTLLDVLNTMSEIATAPELKDAFSQHVAQTQQQLERLEQILTGLNWGKEPRQSIGLQGLFDEGWREIDNAPAFSAERDVALIIAAQQVEHYEIARYGSLVALAKTLNWDNVAALLETTLAEERQTDALLTGIAERHINYDASLELAEKIATA